MSWWWWRGEVASLESRWEAQRWKVSVALGGGDEGLKPTELCECLEQPALQGSLYTLVSRPPSASAPLPTPMSRLEVCSLEKLNWRDLGSR